MNSSDIVARIKPVWPDPRRFATFSLLAIMAGFALSSFIAFQ